MYDSQNACRPGTSCGYDTGNTVSLQQANIGPAANGRTKIKTLAGEEVFAEFLR